MSSPTIPGSALTWKSWRLILVWLRSRGAGRPCAVIDGGRAGDVQRDFLGDVLDREVAGDRQLAVARLGDLR